jgi:phage terminase small subunit
MRFPHQPQPKVQTEMETDKPKAPAHLSVPSRRWFEQVVTTYSLEPHHLHLLGLAAQALDRAETARLALATHGQTFTDRFGCPRARPEIAIERDARIGFARLVRELDLDTDATPTSSRPPALRSNRRN